MHEKLADVCKMGGSVRYYVSKTVGLSCAVSRSFIQCFYTVGWVTDFQPVKIFPIISLSGQVVHVKENRAELGLANPDESGKRM